MYVRMWISLGCLVLIFNFEAKSTPNIAEVVSFSKSYFGTDTDKSKTETWCQCVPSIWLHRGATKRSQLILTLDLLVNNTTHMGKCFKYAVIT
jgi:hypothetical protein